jgi:hypothetical protein
VASLESSTNSVKSTQVVTGIGSERTSSTPSTVEVSSVPTVQIETDVLLKMVESAKPYVPETAKDDVEFLIGMFEENEARGLLKFFEKSKEFDHWAEIMEIASGVISEKIVRKNRSKKTLHFMRVLNMFHEHKKHHRFRIILGLTTYQLYDLIWRWRGAIYTSSLNGVVDRIIEKVNNEKIDFYKILEIKGFEHIDVFLEGASSYNRALDVMQLFTVEQQCRIMYEYMLRLERKGSLRLAVSWIEIMLATREPKLKEYMGTLLKSKVYISLGMEPLSVEAVPASTSTTPLTLHQMKDLIPDPTKELYQLMVGAYAQFYDMYHPPCISVPSAPQSTIATESVEISKNSTKARCVQLKSVYAQRDCTSVSSTECQTWDEDLAKWAKMYVKNHARFRMPDYSATKSSEMFDENGVNVQRHYFFNDLDGRTTYFVFKKQYQKDPSWTVEEYKTYLKIWKKCVFSNRTVIMYANKPRQWKKARKYIAKELGKHGDIFHSFIYRGHSYKLWKCIPDITNRTMVAVLGSCGGFENIESVLKLSLYSSIVLSKGTGTIWINNTLIKEMNELLLLGDNLQWKYFRISVRNLIEKKLGTRDIKDKILHIFDNFYVMPNENVGLSMVRRYMELRELDQLKSVFSSAAHTLVPESDESFKPVTFENIKFVLPSYTREQRKYDHRLHRGERKEEPKPKQKSTEAPAWLKFD